MEVPLVNGGVAIIDECDSPIVGDYLWYREDSKTGRTSYARRKIGRNRWQYLHTFLTGWPMVDHRNGNGLDNSRSNLRSASLSQNKMNVPKARGAYSSKFKGVSKDRERWRAVIYLNGKRTHLGTFDSEIEAAKAYDAAALRLFGEWALPNFAE